MNYLDHCFIGFFRYYSDQIGQNLQKMLKMLKKCVVQCLILVDFCGYQFSGVIYILFREDNGVYEVLQEDMKNTQSMFQQLIALAHPQYVTLFLCEVSLVYLPFEVSDKILKILSEIYERSVCLLYEQVNTKDPFGKFMVKHFKKIT